MQKMLFKGKADTEKMQQIIRRFYEKDANGNTVRKKRESHERATPATRGETPSISIMMSSILPAQLTSVRRGTLPHP